MERWSVDRIRQLTPTEFEFVTKAVFEELGYEAVHTGGSGDGGIDLVLETPDGARALAQCKRYSETVGPAAVREFFGVLTHENAIRGYLVTTGTFSLESERWAHGKPIVLVDGSQFANVLNESSGETHSLVESFLGIAPQSAAEAPRTAFGDVRDLADVIEALVKSAETVGRLSAPQIEIVHCEVADARSSLTASVVDTRLVALRASVVFTLRLVESELQAAVNRGSLSPGDRMRLGKHAGSLRKAADEAAQRMSASGASSAPQYPVGPTLDDVGRWTRGVIRTMHSWLPGAGKKQVDSATEDVGEPPTASTEP